jgi:hypothetical protein
MNLIKNSWFTSHKQNSALLKVVRSDVYAERQNPLIEVLLEKCPPIVATLEAVPDEVVGWVCRDLAFPIVHYVYVKHPFRRTGIASVLVSGSKRHTHQTRAGELLFRRRGSLYDPYLLPGVFDV